MEVNAIQEPDVVTVEQVLDATVRNLQQINVPISQIDSIGLPIYQAVNNLKECIRAITDAQKEVPKDDA